MDNSVWIVLIVAVAVIVVLYMFRGALSKFFLKANRNGVEAGLETREMPSSGMPDTNSPHKVNISGNKQIGAEQKINVAQSDVNVSDNLQAGRKQSIDVKADKQ